MNVLRKHDQALFTEGKNCFRHRDKKSEPLQALRIQKISNLAKNLGQTGDEKLIFFRASVLLSRFLFKILLGMCPYSIL